MEWNTEEFVLAIEKNTFRYLKLFAQAVDELMPDPSEPLTAEQEDAVDILWMHRKRQSEAQRLQQEGSPTPATSAQDLMKNTFPDELRRRL